MTNTDTTPWVYDQILTASGGKGIRSELGQIRRDDFRGPEAEQSTSGTKST